MFEKSKSAITFKEFQDKMNIANNFDNDWGHFCDPDPSTSTSTSTSVNVNILFQDNLHKLKKKELKKLLQKEQEKNLEEDLKQLEEESEEQKEIEKIKKDIFIDIKDENLHENNNNKNTHYLKDATKVAIIKNILKCFEIIFVISITTHFIFNVL